MTASASKIVRSLVTLTCIDPASPAKSCTVFNDSRSFGRSIKVWGWDETDYSNAKRWLEMAGYKVKLVRTRRIKSPGWAMSSGGKLRLWIYA